MNIVETTGLSKRYRGTWALRGCCLAIPEGRVAALVGPNGSGKTTLLNITVGLIAPTTGRVTVLGTEPAGSAAARDDIAFVAQDVLDEPLSSLDPLSRHAFVSSVMSAVAEDAVSVILSSHILAELERVTDYLIILSHGQVQVAGDTDDLIATHRLLTGMAPTRKPDPQDGLPPHWTVVEADWTSAQQQLLVRLKDPDQPVPDGFTARSITLEELALAYLRQPGAGALPGPDG